MRKKFQDRMINPWRLLLCVVVLGVSSFAFYLFVSPRSRALNGETNTVRDATGSSDSSVPLTHEEYVTMVRTADEQFLEDFRTQKRKKRRQEKLNAMLAESPESRWQRYVDRLKSDLEAIGKDQPKLRADVENQLEKAMRDRPAM